MFNAHVHDYTECNKTNTQNVLLELNACTYICNESFHTLKKNTGKEICEMSIFMWFYTELFFTIMYNKCNKSNLKYMLKYQNVF